MLKYRRSAWGMMALANWTGRAWGSFWDQVNGSRIGIGLLVASPAIFTWVAGLLLEVSVDNRLRPLNAQIAQITETGDYLNGFVARFEEAELNRGVTNLTLTAVNAPANFRYLADNLYRINSGALGSLRRAAAIVYPDSWQDMMKTYEKTLTDGYSTPEEVAALQAVDNDVMLGARKQLTAFEKQLVGMRADAGALETRRRWISMFLQPLGIIFTLLAFIYNLKPKSS